MWKVDRTMAECRTSSISSAFTLLLHLRTECFLLRLVHRDGHAGFDGYVQILHGSGTLETIQIVDCTVLLQRLRRLQSEVCGRRQELLNYTGGGKKKKKKKCRTVRTFKVGVTLPK